MDTVRLQQIKDRYKVASASGSAGIDPALALRVCEALGQPVAFVHKIIRQRLAYQLAQEYLLSDMKSLLHAVEQHDHRHSH